MAKYSKELVDKMVALIEEDNYTITEICRILGVGRISFYKWKESKPEFAQAIDCAIEFREEKFKQQARRAMQKKMEGQRQMETKTVYVTSKDNPNQLVVKEYVVKEKYCVPETSAIVFALSDKEKKNKQKDNKRFSPNDNPLIVNVSNEDTKRHMEILRSRLDGSSPNPPNGNDKGNLYNNV